MTSIGALLAMAAVAVPSAAAATVPVTNANDSGSVVTDAATWVTPASATLHGTVNPTNLTTTYHFEYGTTTAYGSSTSTHSAGSDYSDNAVSAAIGGLSPNMTYHFQVVATNAIGTSYGADRTFTTAAKPKLRLSVSPRSAHTGRRACFTFTARGASHGISGATVRFAHRSTRTAGGGRGRICVAFSRPGLYTARASKPGYRSASARVHRAARKSR